MPDLLLLLRLFTLAVWVFWLLIYWRGGTRALKDIRAARSPSDREAMIVILTLAGVLFTTGLLVVSGGVAVLGLAENTLIALAGAALALLGAAATFYCRAYLGRFWTAEAALQDNHQIIDTGPYALVRHPIYAAALTMYGGTTMVFATPWTLLAYALLVIAHMLKVCEEERLLIGRLPAYAEYRRHVRRRLIPGLW